MSRGRSDWARIDGLAPITIFYRRRRQSEEVVWSHLPRGGNRDPLHHHCVRPLLPLSVALNCASMIGPDRSRKSRIRSSFPLKICR